MAISARFTIDGNPTGIDATTGQMVGVVVSPTATVTLRVVDTSSVQSVTWEIIGKSSDFAAPEFSLSGTPGGSTATLVCPDATGIACGVRARAVGPYGGTAIWEGKFYTNGANDFEASYEGETGWAYRLNAQLNTIFGAL